MSSSSFPAERWWNRTCTHLLLQELQNYNLILNNHWQKNVGPQHKRIFHVQGQRRSPNKTVGGVKSHLESNPIPARNAWRAQTKPYVHQDPEAPQRLSQTHLWVFECLLWRYGSAVTCCRDRGTGCRRPGSCSVTHHRASKQMNHNLQNYYTKEILTLLRKL